MPDDEIINAEIASILGECKEQLHVLECEAHEVVKDYRKKLEEVRLKEVQDRLQNMHDRTA